MAMDRRELIRRAGVGVVGASALTATRSTWSHISRPLSVGLIGCGGRGRGVAETFSKLNGVDITHVCDPQADRLASAAKQFAVGEKQAVDDMRQLLDDKSVGAVIVATPDHWHSPAAILACEAGKHVYVEKPCSHNVREGRLLVEAARRNDRVVQHGTQVRSTPMMIEAIQMLHEGIIGDVLVAKAWNIQRRRSIGRDAPSTPPPGFNYDLWVGPATMLPYQRNRVNDGWHWWYHFGTGDMGNDGVHDVEYARWGLGVSTHPVSVSASGGKYFFDDDQQFPDTQYVSFEYAPDDDRGNRRMLVYEQRLWSTNYPHNTDSGVEFYGTEGQMYLSRRGKIQLLGERNKQLEQDIQVQPQDTDRHVADFVQAIHDARRPNADIELGHMTASLCHLGNISTRLGRSFRFDGASEQIIGDDEANQLLRRGYREHWGRPRNV